MDVAPERLPLLPEKLLRRHHVHEASDTRFRAAARLRQALWRESNGLPIGQALTANGRMRRLGSRISSAVSHSGANLIDATLRPFVQRELAYREPGAYVDEARLWTNLLSSMPLAFSLFAPLKRDSELAQAVLTAAFPDLLARVTGILFEHSPGRGDPAFLDDYTAFDVLVRGEDAAGQRTFVAIEVKFAESMAEPTARLRPRYDHVSRSSGLYADPDADELRNAPLQQLWREHMLAASMIERGQYARGAFVLLAPEPNRDVQRAVRRYVTCLAGSEPSVTFENVHLEAFVGRIADAGASDLAAALHERYCDYSSVHALV